MLSRGGDPLKAFGLYHLQALTPRLPRPPRGYFSHRGEGRCERRFASEDRTTMTTTQTRTAPSRRVPPAARKPGPVTLAIRVLRPNEAPSWEIRQAEIAAEERAALRALRRRVAQAVADGIDFLDATGGDPDFEVTREDDEDTNDAEAVNEDATDDAEAFA